MNLVADRRDVLLGCYSVSRFAMNLAITAVLWLVAWLVFRVSRGRARQAAFRLVAALLASLFAAIVVVVAARLVREPRYVEEPVELREVRPGGPALGILRRRQPDLLVQIRYDDVPPTARSFPFAPNGHPAVDVTLTTDDLGFRNRQRRERYEIVTIGDSFVEGSKVDDEEVWPVLLEGLSGRSVYNLGIGGTKPSHYLAALAAIGADLEPEVALVMLYEGNDFVRSADSGPDLDERMAESPVLQAANRALVRFFGPIRARAPVPGGEVLSWMPIGLPEGAEARYYVFRPKRLLALFRTEEDFRASAEWVDTASVLAQIQSLCESRGIRLLLVYAPSKPHVVMPLVAERVPDEKLHGFVSLKAKELPEPGEFARLLQERIGNPEKVVREFSEERGIAFVSTTELLREAVAAGHQAYYTWDPHWTPLGHALVAAELNRRLAGGLGP